MNTKKILEELKVAWLISKMNYRNEAELKTSFMVQVIGMVVNDAAFLFVWLFFFSAFGTINNWSYNETIALQGYIALTFGLAFSFGDGARYLAERVHNGIFDNLLLRPKNLYLSIVTSNMQISALGDVLYGLILFGIYIFVAHPSFLQIFLLLTMAIPTTLIFLNIAIICSLVAFFVPDADKLSKNLFEVFFSPSFYPSSLYTGAIRFVFFFIIPAIAIGGVPVEIVRDVNIPMYLVIWALGIGWTILASFLLKLAVKRYESSNLIGARE
jgi:ABC-2 type transport system permease protein